MKNVINITPKELIHQLKISCQIPSVMEGIATRKIIASAAEKEELKVELEELQQAADKLRLINNLQRTDETLAWLQKHCLSVDDFEEIAYISVLSSKLAQHLFKEQVQPFFIEHELDYAQAVIYEVVLDDEDLAMEIFYAIQEGEIGFHEVARQYIQDTELRRGSGYRGTLRRIDLKPEISAAVFVSTPPQVLKPILTSKGAHLILVEELIQPQLDDALGQKILSDLFSTWLKQQLAQTETVLSSSKQADPRLSALA